MAVFRTGKVVEVTEASSDIVWARVSVDGDEVEAAGWPFMLGPLSAGDRVVVNMTGVELGLGTGGVGFILWDLDGPGPEGPGRGHIVKLRYTPWQTEVDAIEAPESAHHAILAEASSIDGMPVVACGLHSQTAGVAAGIKSALPAARVGYLMTDAGALPLSYSRLITRLRGEGLVDVTATCGHAFGGDLEAVNVHSALVALKHSAHVDTAIVALGPGVVGTGTRLGFSALEQGQVLDAAEALQGRGVAALRITFAEGRDRQRGVSHHTITALQIAARERTIVAVPLLADEQRDEVRMQLEAAGIAARHEIVVADGTPGLELMKSLGLRVTSMGRNFESVQDLHLAAAAAGRVAAELR